MSMEMVAWSAMYNAAHGTQEQRPFSRATLRRIAVFARPHRSRLIAFLVISVLGAALAVATPVLAGRIIDAIVSGGPLSLVIWLAVLIAGIAVAPQVMVINPGLPARTVQEVIALTKALSKELATYDIAVNCITPAAARTRILEQMSQTHVDWMLSKIPRGRFLEIDELAALALDRLCQPVGEGRVLERMVFHVHREPPRRGVERRSLGHRPAHEDSVDLEAKVVVQPAGPMPLDHEPQGAGLLLLAPCGLWRTSEVALAAVDLEWIAHACSVPLGAGCMLWQSARRSVIRLSGAHDALRLPRQSRADLPAAAPRRRPAR